MSRESDFIKQSIELAVSVAEELHPNNSELWALTYNYVFLYASEGKCVKTLIDSLRDKKSI